MDWKLRGRELALRELRYGKILGDEVIGKHFMNKQLDICWRVKVIQLWLSDSGEGTVETWGGVRNGENRIFWFC